MCISKESCTKYLAELIGTFLLTSTVIFSLNGTLAISTPIMAALMLGLWVYTTGHISGAHINPAVTLGTLVIKKIEPRDALGYIVSQFIGASLAMFVAKYMGIVNTVMSANSLQIVVAELLGTAVLSFGVASVIYGKVSKSLSGLVIGASLFFGIFFASTTSHGVLNPAVAFGINSFNLAYLIGPSLGGTLGMLLFKYLSNEK